MGNNIRYVKCEVCGRSLPGPPRKCDLCDGRMTYRAAESYYTPEGIMSRRKGSVGGASTPATDSRSKRERKRILSDRNRDKIEWLGIANKTEQETSDSTRFSNFKEVYERKPVVKYVLIVAAAIAVILFATTDWNQSPSYSYETIYSDDVATNDRYELTDAKIEFSVPDEDEEYDSEMIQSLYVYFSIRNLSDEDLVVYPLNELDVTDEKLGYPVGALDFISIMDEQGDEEFFYGDGETTVLNSGETYYFTISYIDVNSWNMLLLWHDLGGGNPDDELTDNIILDNDVI